jgi:hypothetical protein
MPSKVVNGLRVTSPTQKNYYICTPTAALALLHSCCQQFTWAPDLAAHTDAIECHDAPGH